MSSTVTVSVVMPTYNRAKMLAQTVPSYLQSDVCAELIVVNDGGMDETDAVVEQLAKEDPRIRYIRYERNQGMQIARNIGAKEASRAFLLFTEDDLILGPGFLEALLDCVAIYDADVVSGRRIWMRPGESREQALQRANRNRQPLVNMRWLEHNSHAITEGPLETCLLSGTMLVKRDVLSEVSYFDGFKGNAWREETDFQLQAVEHGYKLMYCPNAIAFHHPRLSQSFGRNRLRSDLIYLYWIYRNNAMLLERHHDFLRERFPSAIIAGSPKLTSILYAFRRAIWLIRTEALRAYLSHYHTIFQWE